MRQADHSAMPPTPIAEIVSNSNVNRNCSEVGETRHLSRLWIVFVDRENGDIGDGKGKGEGEKGKGKG
jgi:hypothetical protein